MTKIVRVMTACAGVMLAAARCSSDTAEEPSPADAATLPAACVSCLGENCPLPLRVCETTGGCQDLVACLADPAQPGCDGQLACVTGAPGFADAGNCATAAMLDPTAIASFESLAVCAGAACGHDCPPAPANEAGAASCRDGFDDAFGAVVSTCSALRECACRRCVGEHLDCFEDPDCMRIATCLLNSGCTGAVCLSELSTCEGSLTRTASAEVAFIAKACLEDQCTPCGDVNAGTP